MVWEIVFGVIGVLLTLAVIDIWRYGIGLKPTETQQRASQSKGLSRLVA